MFTKVDVKASSTASHDIFGLSEMDDFSDTSKTILSPFHPSHVLYSALHISSRWRVLETSTKKDEVASSVESKEASIGEGISFEVWLTSFVCSSVPSYSQQNSRSKRLNYGSVLEQALPFSRNWPSPSEAIVNVNYNGTGQMNTMRHALTNLIMNIWRLPREELV